MTTSRLLTPDAVAATLGRDVLDQADIVTGSPASSSATLAVGGGIDIGIWELTPGTVTDTEVDEIFVVLAGRGQVTFADREVVSIGPGSVVRLRAGERTTWTITETLRKIYVLLPIDSSEGPIS